MTAVPFAVARLKLSPDQPGQPYAAVAMSLGFQLLGALAQEVGEDAALRFARRLTSFVLASPDDAHQQADDWLAVLDTLARAADRP